MNVVMCNITERANKKCRIGIWAGRQEVGRWVGRQAGRQTGRWAAR